MRRASVAEHSRHRQLTVDRAWALDLIRLLIECFDDRSAAFPASERGGRMGQNGRLERLLLCEVVDKADDEEIEHSGRQVERMRYVAATFVIRWI